MTPLARWSSVDRRFGWPAIVAANGGPSPRASTNIGADLADVLGNSTPNSGTCVSSTRVDDLSMATENLTVRGREISGAADAPRGRSPAPVGQRRLDDLARVVRLLG